MMIINNILKYSFLKPHTFFKMIYKCGFWQNVTKTCTEGDILQSKNKGFGVEKHIFDMSLLNYDRYWYICDKLQSADNINRANVALFNSNK